QCLLMLLITLLFFFLHTPHFELYTLSLHDALQAYSLALSVRETFNITPWVTGVIIMLLMAVVIIGGIKRIGSFTEKLVPMMIILYLVGTFLVVIIHIDMFTEVLSLIFGYAFQ